uniref:Uncharacterized protein n=1 Tax=Cacopsylla melanoneura TaxID=428564 RepID=A0A8D8VW79_9HEMI
MFGIFHLGRQLLCYFSCYISLSSGSISSSYECCVFQSSNTLLGCSCFSAASIVCLNIFCTLLHTYSYILVHNMLCIIYNIIWFHFRLGMSYVGISPRYIKVPYSIV